MAFPASTLTLKNGLDSALGAATKIKTYVTNARNASAQGPVGRGVILNLARLLSDAIANFDSVAAIPGIGAYAQAQFADSNLDVVAEFTTMRNAATALRDWIVSNFPTDTNSGAVLVYTLDANGTLTELTFTTTQLATFRTQADAFTATIS